MKFLIGYEVGSGNPVQAELHHLFISGVTQHSGKTTSLEAFIDRVQPRRTLVFRCGRGEIGFDRATKIRPFFRERTDWRYVEGFLSAHLQEKTKFFRAEIMKATRGAKSLDDVHGYVKRALNKARKGSWDEKVYTELEQYFSEVLPIVRSLDLSNKLEIGEGMNLIDLVGVPLAVQQLVISSCADYIMDNLKDVILVVPEAWQMVPEDRTSPVKLAVENITRQGAKIGNYVWLDSQQMTGVDMQILRNVDIWMFGRQTLDLEKHRVAKTIPAKKLKMDDIHNLTIGEFYVVLYGEQVRKVYVQPTWMPADLAQGIAKGDRLYAEADEYRPKEKVVDMDEQERKRYEDEIRGLRKTIEDQAHYRGKAEKELGEVRRLYEEMRKQLSQMPIVTVEETRQNLPASLRDPSPAPASPPPSVEGAVDLETLATKVAEMLSSPDTYHLQVSANIGHMQLTERIHEISATDDEPLGRMALLVAQGFFDERKSINEVRSEFNERAWGAYTGGSGWNNLDRLGKKLAEMGFLRNVDKGYVVVPDAKTRIKKVRA